MGSCGGVGRALHWVTLFISGDDWTVKWTLDVYVCWKRHVNPIITIHRKYYSIMYMILLYSSIAVYLHCSDVVSGPQTQMHARKLGT